MGKSCATILQVDGSNYAAWRLDIEDFLATKQLSEYLTNPAPAGRDAATALVEDRQALGYVRGSCELPVKGMIANRRTTAETMVYLQQRFRAASDARLAVLDRRDIKTKPRFEVSDGEEPASQAGRRHGGGGGGSGNGKKGSDKDEHGSSRYNHATVL